MMHDRFYQELDDIVIVAPRAAGGPGSGNFGHGGRPGEVGGSADGPGDATVPGTEHSINQLYSQAEKAGHQLFDTDDSGLLFERQGVVSVINMKSVAKDPEADLKNDAASMMTGTFEYQFDPESGEGKDVSDTDVHTLTPSADGRIYLYDANEGIRVIDTTNKSKSAEIGERSKPSPEQRATKIVERNQEIRKEMEKEFVDHPQRFPGWTTERFKQYLDEGWSTDHAAMVAREIKRDSKDPKGKKIRGAIQHLIRALEQTWREMGGAGSGNFGHAGRPGEVGGSGESEPGGVSKERKAIENAMNNKLASLGVGKPSFPSKANYEQRGAMKSQVVKELAPKLAATGTVLVEAHTIGPDGQPTVIMVGTDAPEAAERAVQETLNQWAATSGDSSPRSVAMQEAVKKEFELEDADMSHMILDPNGPQPSPSNYSNPKGVSLDKLERRDYDQAYVRLEYEQTQQFLKDNGITHVSVYRGQRDIPSTHKDGPLEVVMQPASSWSTSLNVASEFSSGHGHIMAVRVPAERVLSCAATGRGCFNEAEVLLLGGRMTVHAVSTYVPGWKKIISEKMVKKASSKSHGTN